MSLAKERLQTGKGVIVQWILSHAGIEGNELADKEAEKHSKNNRTCILPNIEQCKA